MSTSLCHLSQRVRSRRRSSVHEWTTAVVDSYSRLFTCFKSLHKSCHILSTICQNVYGRVHAHWSRRGSGGMMYTPAALVAPGHTCSALYTYPLTSTPLARTHGLKRSNVSQSLSSADALSLSFSCRHSPQCLQTHPRSTYQLTVSILQSVTRILSFNKLLSPCLTLTLHLSRRVRSRRRSTVHEWTTSVVDSYSRLLLVSNRLKVLSPCLSICHNVYVESGSCSGGGMM